jgi:hypothetical protein
MHGLHPHPRTILRDAEVPQASYGGLPVRGDPGFAMQNEREHGAPVLDDALDSHVGPRRDHLMALFGITTLPALVLLDGMGVVVCHDGCRMVLDKQASRGVTPPRPRQPVLDCDLPPELRRLPTSAQLPPHLRLDLRHASRPPGVPPSFNEEAKESQAAAPTHSRAPTGSSATTE